MIRLDSFHSAVQAIRGDAQVALDTKKTGVTVRSRRLARWAGKFRRSANREVTGVFIESLRNRYGGEVTDHLVKSTGMDRVMASGKPLSARHVAEIVGKADALHASIVDRNAHVAASYNTSRMEDKSDISLLQFSLERQSNTLFPTNPNMHRLVDADGLSGMVEREIRAAGNNDAHFVTTQEAAQILTEVVRRELQAAYETARHGALEKMSLEEPNSILRRALATATARREPALNIDPDRFEADLNDRLHRRIESAVARHLAGPAVGDESALQALANKLMEDFVEETAAVRDAVERLPIDAAEKEKMLDQALHDNHSARVIAAMGQAYLEVRGDLSELGKPLGPAELQEPLSRICNSMTSAFEECGYGGLGLSEDYRSIWRFLLAPGGGEQARAIAGRMEHPGSALRAVGQGASWFRNIFPNTKEGSQSVLDGPGRKQPKYAASFDTADRFLGVMNNLAKVLRDKTDVSGETLGLGAQDDGLLPRENQSDGVIAMLRNVGIAMPAPDRMGETNPDAPISQAVLVRIREEIDEHVAQTASKRVTNGILAECMRDFGRSTYRVDGQTLPDNSDGVAAGLRAFCTDVNGRLDEEMLLGISRVAYQVLPLTGFGALFDARSPETSLFQGNPVLDQDAQDLVYTVSRNYDSEDGEVTVNMRLSAPMNHLLQVTDNFELATVSLDPNQSHLDLTMDLKLDAASDFKPTVEAVNVGYSLFPRDNFPDQ